MKAEEIVFLHYPCMVVVCESANTPNSTDPETNDIREYARIIKESYVRDCCSGYQLVPAGKIKWTKHIAMLSEGHIRLIEQVSDRLREEDKERLDYLSKIVNSSRR